jgi:exodeoxyribonuclease V beta subunit
MTPVRPFDLAAPLPRRRTLLDASAGTGKTFTIAGLVARYVAAGTPLTDILVITFTRAATAELRERIRLRLLDAAEGLRRFDGALVDADDVITQIARENDPAEAARRLDAALNDFDAATITTIHGFCQQVLAGVGLAGDVDRDARLMEQQDDLVESVLSDVIVRRFATGQATMATARRTLGKLVRAAVDNPDALLVPGADADPEAATRRWLAEEVRQEVDLRKRAGRWLSYDDLLTRLRDALRDDEQGAVVRRRLRGAYRVALIDEFQDTDPVQWEIVDGAFADMPLILIGDPKQAIYSFRGADVSAYIAAASTAGDEHTRTLRTNWRTDQGLLQAFNLLFEGATLGEDAIAYHEVHATASHQRPRLVGAPGGAPFRLRVVRRDADVRLVGRTRDKIQAHSGREFVARDLAAQVVELLESGAEILDTDDRGGVVGRHRVRPADVAVLVRKNAEAVLLQQSLRGARVPAVINGVGSVFATPAAMEWLRLLEALERPSDGARARSAALTAFVGWSADRVDTATDAQWEHVHQRLHRWADVLRHHSLAALWQTVRVEQGLPGRLLAGVGGERALTDLDHLGDLLHATVVTGERAPTGLAGWLRARIGEAEQEVESEERARRLESDAEAVQVLTIHRSKGLEFPIVYCPYLWFPGFFDVRDSVPVFHDDDIAVGRRIIDVGGRTGPDFDAHAKRAKREQRDEDLRLLYVALTRARHHVVLWWARGYDADESPLSRLLFCRRDVIGPANTRCQRGMPGKTDDEITERLRAFAARSAGTMVVEESPRAPEDRTWQGVAPSQRALSSATFARGLDHTWRRTSYSALTAHLHEGTGGSAGSGHSASERDAASEEADTPVTVDEDLAEPIDRPIDRPVADVVVVVEAADVVGRPGAEPVAGGRGDEESLRAVSLPLAGMPGGTQPGTFVHAVLEGTDFAAADLPGEVAQHLAETQRRTPLDVGGLDDVRDGLCQVIATPMGSLVGDRALRDISRPDRLDEVTFELPLAGGFDRSPDGEPTQVTVRAIGKVIAEHLADDGLLATYAERLTAPAIGQRVHGYLTGSIDAVLRVRDGEGVGKFVVVDYKTNRLGGGGEDLTAWHYRPEALTGAMMRGHYPLQALLYCVALHRYLRWRLPEGGYDPDIHLGGVLYLFVRGMVGAETPLVDGQRCGVFSWRPPTRLVTDLSDLLHHGGGLA